MLKNACVLIAKKYIFPFQNLHAENIKSQQTEKKPFKVSYKYMFPEICWS